METAEHEIEKALSEPLTAECLSCGHSSVLPQAFNQHCLKAGRPSAMLKHLFFRLICSVCSIKVARLVSFEGHILMSRDQTVVAQESVRAEERKPKKPKPLPRKSRPVRPPVKAAGPHPAVASTPRLARAPDECVICRCLIEPDRLAILPDANTCVDCARKKSRGAKRKLAEPWGSREDWKKDSGVNFARAARPKI